YHGLMQVLYRAGIIKSMSFLGIEYYQGLTLHGVINVLVFTTMIIVALGNAVFLYYLKKPLRPAVQWVSFLMMVVGTLMAAWAMFAGKANVLYTFYYPLIAHPAFYIGAALLIIGSEIPLFFDWAPNYIAWRREHPGEKVPLAVYGIFVNHIMWVIMCVPLCIETFFQLLPASLGLVSEVNTSLSRTLLWAFGHPVVYFWLLPAYAMIYTILPKIVTGEGKLYSDSAARLVFLLFALFSFPVGLHHQYAEPGITNSYKLIHSFFTLCVAVPSVITAFTIAASLEYSIKSKYPEVRNSLFYWWTKIPYISLEGDKWLVSYLMAGLLLFFVGGITGIVNASYNLNLVVHNTSFVPGHFHTTVGGISTLTFLGLSLYIVSKLMGKDIKFKGLAVVAPWLWFIGMLIFGYSMSVAGILGFPRRTNTGLSYLNPESPLYRPEWLGYAQLAAVAGFIIVLGFVFWAISFFGTIFSPKVRESTLEFPTASALHDENIPALNRLTPWFVVSVLLFVLAYIPPIYDVTQKGVFLESPPYNDKSPMPLTKPQNTKKDQKNTAEAR
ncbi:MAG: cbb3-type cytochrome c oxidase subunit I, partial [Thermocrinis sp.]|nr:cbb3-type cytochrome c oxidase subunit I [Thermocrinis sp.]